MTRAEDYERNVNEAIIGGIIGIAFLIIGFKQEGLINPIVVGQILVLAGLFSVVGVIRIYGIILKVEWLKDISLVIFQLLVAPITAFYAPIIIVVQFFSSTFTEFGYVLANNISSILFIVVFGWMIAKRYGITYTTKKKMSKKEQKQKITYIRDLINDLKNNYNKLETPEYRPNYKIRKLDLQRKFLGTPIFTYLKLLNDEIYTLHEDIDRLLNVIQPQGNLENTRLLQEQIIRERQKLKELTISALGLISPSPRRPSKSSRPSLNRRGKR